MKRRSEGGIWRGSGGAGAQICSALLGIAMVAMALTASAGTKLAFSWRNPAYTGGSFKNILILAVNGKATRRADFEDRMVTVLVRPGVLAVQSYLVDSEAGGDADRSGATRKWCRVNTSTRFWCRG